MARLARKMDHLVRMGKKAGNHLYQFGRKAVIATGHVASRLEDIADELEDHYGKDKQSPYLAQKIISNKERFRNARANSRIAEEIMNAV